MRQVLIQDIWGEGGDSGSNKLLHEIRVPGA